MVRRTSSEIRIAFAEGRLTSEEQFGDIVVKTGSDGEVTRLRDLARIELGDLVVDALRHRALDLRHGPADVVGDPDRVRARRLRDQRGAVRRHRGEDRVGRRGHPPARSRPDRARRLRIRIAFEPGDCEIGIATADLLSSSERRA
jgi:hypothetical protein